MGLPMIAYMCHVVLYWAVLKRVPNALSLFPVLMYKDFRINAGLKSDVTYVGLMTSKQQTLPIFL